MYDINILNHNLFSSELGGNSCPSSLLMKALGRCKVDNSDVEAGSNLGESNEELRTSEITAMENQILGPQETEAERLEGLGAEGVMSGRACTKAHIGNKAYV